MKMFFFGLLAYFMVTSSIFECKSSKSEISDLNLILKDKTIDQILNELSRKNTRERNLRYASSSADGSEKRNEFESSILKIPHKRPRNTRKQKSLIHNGYSLDMNVENFKSLRYCYFNEVCKNRYKPYFECVCPKSTLCTGQGGLFEGTCTNHLMPYVWVQSVDENQLNRF